MRAPTVNVTRTVLTGGTSSSSAGAQAAERYASVRVFLEDYRYAPARDTRDVAEELYEEVGSTAVTLIRRR